LFGNSLHYRPALGINPEEVLRITGFGPKGKFRKSEFGLKLDLLEIARESSVSHATRSLSAVSLKKREIARRMGNESFFVINAG
jgi:hypothetical protein